jgi:hypothetical protein
VCCGPACSLDAPVRTGAVLVLRAVVARINTLVRRSIWARWGSNPRPIEYESTTPERCAHQRKRSSAPSETHTIICSLNSADRRPKSVEFAVWGQATTSRRITRRVGRLIVLSLVSFLGLVVVAVGFTIDLTILISEAADDIEPVAIHCLQALWDNDFVALGVLTSSGRRGCP